MPIQSRSAPALLSVLILVTALSCDLSASAPTLTPQGPTIALPTGAPSDTAVPAAPASVRPTETEEPPRKAASLPDPSLVRWAQIAGGFSKPVDLQHAGDERLFIVEQRGVIWVIEAGQKQEQPFLDLRDRVNAGTSGTSERGLLGLAFHPDSTSNGKLYVNYTNARGETVIARFEVLVNQARADASSEQVMMTISQPFPNHNGGGAASGFGWQLDL